VLSVARLLRSPSSGILAQGVRFGIAGGTVAVVYLAITTLLAEVAGLPFQAALAIGFSIAIAVHFTLQRVFVWAHRDQFALPLGHQVVRYLAVAAAQYGITAAATALLPSALGVATELVYLATVAVVLSVNFLVFRHRIFHARPSHGPVGPTPPTEPVPVGTESKPNAEPGANL
jgi:putative flippase GtrA